MTNKKISSVDGIPRKTVAAVLAEFEKMMKNEISVIDTRILSERHAAPAPYISDMKGFSRGLSIMGNMALKFFQEKLLDDKDK